MKSDPRSPAPVFRRDPERTPAPAVFDSPHSGRDYPEDFRPAAPLAILRRTEDAFVEELYASAPAQGAALIGALFPRVYIDPNRALADLDSSMVDGGWPDAAGGEKAQRGIGLIWRVVPPSTAIYDRLLSQAEVRQRIDRYWRPYQDAVDESLAEAHARDGAVWHVNCHSMPSMGDISAGDPGRKRADFVLGDRDGTSCAPEFVQLVEDTLRALGYSVLRNDPFKGVELVRRNGQPDLGRHSLQIEINRALYMNESTIQKSPNFMRLRGDIGVLIERICAFARERARS
ncbi:MAG: N-formylglutamate amidohydrolase [Alphaproteobacteria bacterium]|nr:N-formylglutamate amidohydrolase [Alphaproteobacteria bacterium]